jgi:hypothetical protein
MFFGMARYSDPLPGFRSLQQGLRDRQRTLTDEEIQRAAARISGRDRMGPEWLEEIRGNVERGLVGTLQRSALAAAGIGPSNLPRWDEEIDWPGVARSASQPYRGDDGELVLSALVPEPNLDRPVNPPIEQVRTITTRDDPRLAGVNERLAAMYADPSTTEAEMADYLAGRGIMTSQIPGWRTAMDWRRTPRFRRWVKAPPETRPAHGVNVDDMALAEPLSVAVRQRPLYGGEIRAYHPTASDRISEWFGDGYAAVMPGDDRWNAADAAGRMRRFLHNPLSPVGPLEAAYDADRRGRLAAGEGRFLESLGHQAEAAGNAAMAAPILGGAGRLGRRALAEARRKARADSLGYSDRRYWHGDRHADPSDPLPDHYPSDTYFSTDQEYADGFARLGGRSAAREFRLRIDRPFDLDPDERHSLSDVADVLRALRRLDDADAAETIASAFGSEITADRLIGAAQVLPDRPIAAGDLLHSLIEQNSRFLPNTVLREAGFDAIDTGRDVIKLASDGIRLRSARFDPARADSTNIRHGLIPIGLGLGAYGSSGEESPEPR